MQVGSLTPGPVQRGQVVQGATPKHFMPLGHVLTTPFWQ